MAGPCFELAGILPLQASGGPYEFKRNSLDKGGLREFQRYEFADLFGDRCQNLVKDGNFYVVIRVTAGLPRRSGRSGSVSSAAKVTAAALGQTRLTALQVFKESIDLVFAFERDQAVVDGLCFEHRVGGVGRFAFEDAGAETVEYCCCLVGGG